MTFIGACPGPGRAFGGPEVPGSVMVQRANPPPTLHPPIHPPAHSAPPSIIHPLLHPPGHSIPASNIYSPTHLPSMNSSIHRLSTPLSRIIYSLLHPRIYSFSPATIIYHPATNRCIEDPLPEQGGCWSQDVLGVLWPDHLQVLLSC